jgi:hypothetical protein
MAFMGYSWLNQRGYWDRYFQPVMNRIMVVVDPVTSRLAIVLGPVIDQLMPVLRPVSFFAFLRGIAFSPPILLFRLAQR